jgi:hypothetical protein
LESRQDPAISFETGLKLTFHSVFCGKQHGAGGATGCAGGSSVSVKLNP